MMDRRAGGTHESRKISCFSWAPSSSLAGRTGLIAGILATLLGWAGESKAAASEWPQFRGNPSLTGVAEKPISDQPRLLWTYDFGGAVESSAAIAGGTVYVGSQSGELAALDLETGEPRWIYDAGAPIGESSPAVHDGRVFIGDLHGFVHAVDAASGQRLWTFETGNEIKASPVVYRDRVLIGSYDEHLYALSVGDGSLLWKVRTEGAVHCTAGVRDGVTYISGCDEIFRAIRISDGKELYTIDSGAYTGASPALAGDLAYFGTFNNEVLAVDLEAKTVLWRYSHPQRNFPFYSSAAVVDGKVVVGGRDRMVHCLDARTGEALWTFATRARVESSPVVAGNRVYVGSNDNRLYILDLETGSKVWEFNAGAAVLASPALADGRLVIGTLDGRVYCFGS